MKKTASILFAVFLLFSIAFPAAAEAKPASVYFDGMQLSAENGEPVIVNQTLLVPADDFLAAAGAEYSIDDAAQSISITGPEATVAMSAGSNTAEWNGKLYELASGMKWIGDTAYIPLRFTATALGYEVAWLAEEKTAVVNSPDFPGESEDLNEQKQADPPAAEQEHSRGFMWKVEHDGNLVYLVGSIHVASENMYPMNPEIEQAFAESDVIVLEIDVSKSDDPEILQLMAEKTMYQDGSSLKDHISAEVYEQLGAALESISLPADALDPFKPWVAATNLEMFRLMQFGFDTEMGIDMYFLKQALERGMPVMELESFEFQLNMFESFSDQLQESMLKEMLAQFNNYDKTAEIYSNLWITGDDQMLIDMIEEMTVNEEMYQAMVADRNVQMTEKILEYLHGEEPAVYFVIAGAAHMLGDHGIVTLLEEKGFNVER